MKTANEFYDDDKTPLENMIAFAKEAIKEDRKNLIKEAIANIWVDMTEDEQEFERLQSIPSLKVRVDEDSIINAPQIELK